MRFTKSPYLELNTARVTFDTARSIQQELTFEYAKKYFADNNVKFEESNKRSLHLINNDGYYTNAAMLLSDQCEHSIKCAVYEGTGKTNFKSRKEFKCNNTNYNNSLTPGENTMNLVREKGIITRKDVELFLNCSSFPAINIINEIVEQGKIIKTGSARSTKYELNKK